jgi:DNA-binding CsgD family transcriptional regulator/tetratricopeptide (TPR) repeat protein
MAFVGRETELARLAAALERAARGQTSRVALSGPAGIGLSSLLSELERRVADLDAVTFARGSAHEPCSGVPYHALASAIRSALADLPGPRLAEVVGPAGHDLAVLLPDLADRLARLGAMPDDPLLSAPDQRVSRLTEAVLGTLDRLAGDGVVLLALEDLHWADPGTRGFVESLLRMSRRLPLCLVVTYRPDELHRRHPMRPLADALAATPGVERVAVPPLDRQGLLSLLEAAMDERPSGSFVAAVAEGSGGNPLLAEQLAVAHASLEGVRLSESFEEILEARLATLSVGAIRCLRVLAAARRPVARGMLTRLELHDRRISALALKEALASGLARAVGDEPENDPRSLVSILHERYAEAIESLGLPAERQGTHAALARALDDRPAEAAWHYEAALRFGAARDAHVRAGEAADEVEPGGTALLHYQRALELVEADGSDARLPRFSPPELLARAAQAAFVAGSFRRAAGLVQQAISERSNTVALGEASARGGRARRDLQLEVGELYERLGRYRWSGGDLVPAIAALETAVQLVPQEAIPERARALGSLAKHLMLDGRFQESASLAEQARDVARACGDNALTELAKATCTLGVDVAYGGGLERGLALLEEASDLARQAGSLDELMRAYANRTTLLDLDSRREAAIDVVAQGVAEARQWGLEAVYGAFLRGNAADCLFNLGRWAASEAECRAALEWSPSGVFFYNPIMYLSMVLVESRADEEASRMVGQLLLQLETVPEGQWTASVQRTAVSYALWRDDPMDALRVARRGWERVLETDDWAQTAASASTTLEACAAAAEHARAHRDFAGVAESNDLARSVLPEAERRMVASGVPESLGARREAELHLGMARGHRDRLRGRHDAAAWDRLASAWSGVPVPYQAAKARWWEATAALHAHDRTRAREALHEAWAIADALPARPLQRELSRLARRGRLQLPESAGVSDSVAVGPGHAGDDLVPSPVAPGVTANDLAALAADTELAAVAAHMATHHGNGADGLSVAASTPHDSLDGAAATASWLDGILQPTSPAREAAARQISERLAAADSEHDADPFNLSPREGEVLRILAQGRTNREIAEQLFISDRTVAVHVRNILMKLGVAGRVEATSVAIRLGLLGDYNTP